MDAQYEWLEELIYLTVHPEPVVPSTDPQCSGELQQNIRLVEGFKGYVFVSSC
jgi:hypothetical protein